MKSATFGSFVLLQSAIHVNCRIQKIKYNKKIECKHSTRKNINKKICISGTIYSLNLFFKNISYVNNDY